MYEVILYYKFFPIENPDALCVAHKIFCRELGVKGRIYIGAEGINGTIGGTLEEVSAYKNHLTSIAGFEEIDFKSDTSETIPFAKLKCKTRDEIVSIHAEADPQNGGHYLEPAEWKKTIESGAAGEDYVMIDVRNDYESKIGHFEGAITPEVENFHEFPEWLDGLKVDKDKKVLMYCTGGIRCEKFSALMKKQGWHDVNQLHGGILRYGKEEGGTHYKGKCFVFDDRLVVPVNEDDMQPIAHCKITGKPADTYINCANMECNKLFVCSEEGARLMDGCCSEACRQSDYKRPFDPENAFRPFRKWYNYFEEDFKERELENQ